MISLVLRNMTTIKTVIFREEFGYVLRLKHTI